MWISEAAQKSMITQVGPNRCRRGSERSVDASVEAENVSTWAENLCLSRSVTTELHTAADKRGRGASCREETRQHTHTHTGCGQNTKVVLSNKSLWYERVRWTHFRRQNNMRTSDRSLWRHLARWRKKRISYVTHRRGCVLVLFTLRLVWFADR